MSDTGAINQASSVPCHENGTVLFITACPYPNGMAVTNRLHLMAKGLVEAKRNCEIVIIAPTEAPWSEPNNTEAQGIFEGIRFRYASGTTRWAGTVIGRRLQTYRGYFSAIRRCARLTQEDVVFMFPYNVLLLLIVRLLASVQGFLLLCERTEHPYLNRKMKHPSTLWLRAFTKYAYRLYDGMLVISPNLKAFFVENIRVNRPILTLPVLFDSEEFSKQPCSTTQPVIFACGNLAEEKDGIHTVIRAFAEIASEFPDFRLVLSGSAPSKASEDSLNRLIIQLGIENQTKILGYVAREEYLFTLQTARVHILAKPPSFQALYCMPTKLAEMLASGRPVIVSNTGVLRSYLTDGTSAFIVMNHGVAEYASSLRRVLQSPNDAASVGLSGRAVAMQEFDYRSATRRIDAFLLTLHDNNKSNT